jgi:NADH-quinone oxidoreductase subunit L
MRKMGGLRPYFPITYWTYLIAVLSISGAPLTAGFFSKDLILWHALASPGGSLGLWLFSWLTAGLTAFYMFRQFFMVFHGESRVAAHVKPHIHESPLVMTVPLILLALGSIFSGWLGPPEFLWGSAWDPWLQPVVGSPHGRHAGLFMELTLITVTLVVAAGGFLLAYRLYCAGPKPVPAAAERGLRRWLANKYYVDELYDRVLVRPFTGLAGWLAEFFDPRVIDGVVNGVAERVSANSAFWRRLQSGNAQHYLVGFLTGAVLLLAYYLSG